MAKDAIENKGEIIIFSSRDKKTELEVKLREETVWLSLNQMADLFGRDKSVVSRHLGNIYKSRELTRKATVANYATVQTEGDRQVTRQVEYYNLDAIISVGYRVNSKRGTQFRIWATNVIKEHLVKGYTLNERRLRQLQQEKIRDLQNAIRLLGYAADNEAVSADEKTALIRIVRDFAYALEILDAYDYQRLEVTAVSRKKGKPISYAEAVSLMDSLRKEYQAGDLFGREKDDTLKSSLGNIFQTFDGKQLYPSLEEKAAHLLYFLVKNHHFVDGNKRIAAFLFLWFLDKSNALYHPDGSKRIADNALVALTLMIAQSQPKEKETIIKVIINLINKKN